MLPRQQCLFIFRRTGMRFYAAGERRRRSSIARASRTAPRQRVIFSPPEADRYGGSTRANEMIRAVRAVTGAHLCDSRARAMRSIIVGGHVKPGTIPVGRDVAWAAL